MTRKPKVSGALDTAGTTASSPMQLLLFHRGAFVAPGSGAMPLPTFIGASPTVDVNYRYLNDGDISADPTGSVDVAVVWDGPKVAMTGSLPNEITQGRC